jgi:predicted dehydrogenase
VSWAVTATVNSAADQPSRYRVAIAGCHRMLSRDVAGHNWAAAFAAVPRSEVVAVFDKGEATRDAFTACWGPLPAFDDYATMLSTVRPDVLCLATRQTQHAEQIDQAVQAGVRGILCEKPLATSMGEVDHIVSVCRRSGVAFTFGLDRRWFPYYRSIVGELQAGIIGEVRSIVAFGLLNLINHGCHWFDRLLDLAGDPEVTWIAGSVESLAGVPANSNRHLDPSGSCQIQLANGIEAFVSRAGSGMAFDVVGSRGRLVIVTDGAETHLWTTGADGKTLLSRTLPAATPAPAGPAAVADLFTALDDGRPTLCGLDCARRASEIGFAVHQSNRDDSRRVTPGEIDRNLRIASFPWGNE